MLPILVAVLGSLCSLVRTRKDLALENLALRQQLVVLRRSKPKRLQLKRGDGIFWTCLSLIWAHWAEVLVIVRPDTVVRWHRRGFRVFWHWKSQGPGRPPASKEVRDLIRRMATENLRWGAPRIHGELFKLGIRISERTVSRLMPRRRKPPAQTWRTFLANHAGTLACIDFLTVPTATFRVFYVCPAQLPEVDEETASYRPARPRMELRRIERETGVRRETISRYSRPADPNAARVFPGSEANSAKALAGSRARPRSSAAAFREAILEKLELGDPASVRPTLAIFDPRILAKRLLRVTCRQAREERNT